jgi:predicted ester cyclase
LPSVSRGTIFPARQKPVPRHPIRGERDDDAVSSLEIPNGGAAMENPNKLLVRRYLEEVLNTGNLERVADFIAPANVEEAKQHIRGVRTTYPDLHVTVQVQIAEGDLVATRVIARATHKGQFQGIEPTNQPIAIDAVNIDRVKDGKIVEHWGAANTFEALQAIGALPLGQKP